MNKMKRAFLLLVVFLSFVQYTFAQDSTIDNNHKQSKWIIGFQFSPDIAYRNLKDKSPNNDNAFFVNYFNKTENIKMSYSSQINIAYQVHHNIQFFTGLQYINFGQQTDWILLTTESNTDVGIGEIKFRYNFHTLNIPIGVSTQFGKRKVNFVATTGVAINYIVKQNQKVQINYFDKDELVKGKENIQTGIKKINLNAFVGAGIAIHLSNNSYIQILPSFTIQTINHFDGLIHSRFYNAGLNIGYFINLKNKRESEVG